MNGSTFSNQFLRLLSSSDIGSEFERTWTWTSLPYVATRNSLTTSSIKSVNEILIFWLLPIQERIIRTQQFGKKNNKRKNSSGSYFIDRLLLETWTIQIFWYILKPIQHGIHETDEDCAAYHEIYNYRVDFDLSAWKINAMPHAHSIATWACSILINNCNIVPIGTCFTFCIFIIWFRTNL